MDTCLAPRSKPLGVAGPTGHLRTGGAGGAGMAPLGPSPKPKPKPSPKPPKAKTAQQEATAVTSLYLTVAIYVKDGQYWSLEC